MGAPQFEGSIEIITFRGLFFFAFAQPKRSFFDRIFTCDEKWIRYDKRRISQITVRKLNELIVEVLAPPLYPQTSRQSTTIFSSTSMTFSPVEPSPIRTRPSSTSSNPEHPIVMPTELIDLCYVDDMKYPRSINIRRFTNNGCT